MNGNNLNNCIVLFYTCHDNLRYIYDISREFIIANRCEKYGCSGFNPLKEKLLHTIIHTQKVSVTRNFRNSEFWEFNRSEGFFQISKGCGILLGDLIAESIMKKLS